MVTIPDIRPKPGVLADGFPVAVNALHRLEVTAEDSISLLRTKVDEYKDYSDDKVLHVINRFNNGFKGEHSMDKGLTILPVGTYLVDIVDSLDWNAGDFGDQHSCYWQGYNGERRRMGQDGTWALRVHFSPKHRDYNGINGHNDGKPHNDEATIEVRERYVERLLGVYPRLRQQFNDDELDGYASNDGARAFLVPWWRLAERPGIKAPDDGQGPQPDGIGRRDRRWVRNNANHTVLKPMENVAGWQQAFGGRWTGDRRTAIMHNAYGSLHLPQLVGLYTKLTGLLPNDVSPGIATFGDAQPYEYDWIFNRHDYMYNYRRGYADSRCGRCNIVTTFRAARHMKIQHTNMDGEKYGPANLRGVWCIDCITTDAKRSPKSDAWTRTRGIKWYA